MALVDLCGELDDSVLAAEAPTANALALHDAVLGLAIGCGGWLIHEIQTSGGDIAPSGQTMETLAASLELLKVMHRSQHAPFAANEVDAARERIFHASA